MKSLPGHLRLWDARLKILEGEYQAAETVLRELRDEKRFAAHNFTKGLIDLEVAYCQAYDGRLADAQASFSSARDDNFEHLDVDEQLVAAWIKQKLAELGPEFGDVVEARLLKESAANAYRSMMDDLGARLAEFVR